MAGHDERPNARPRTVTFPAWNRTDEYLVDGLPVHGYPAIGSELHVFSRKKQRWYRCVVLEQGFEYEGVRVRVSE